ncbi:MAG: S8 family peptidase [Ignavibacteria bacterium]|nr:S8 family peptidase [Ignavibacteria bacterium]
MRSRVLSPVVVLLAVALSIWGCSEQRSPVSPGDEFGTVSNPLFKIAPGQDRVPNSYIVVLKGDVANVPEVASDMARLHAVAIGHVYQTAIKGYSATIPEARLEAVRNDSRVAYVEYDYVVSVGPGVQAKPGGSAAQTTPWGITRVGGAGDGTGKTAWVIDTGIDLDHPDLNVDVARSRNFVSRGKNSPDDGHGHGTHVAGTIAAINNSIDVVGVAANASVVAVRVLDNSGSGSYSQVIAGVDYVASAASAGDVANMSLGGPPSTALDDAVLNAAGKGIKFSLAAGNDGADANDFSPARVNHTNVYTISAIASNDCMPSWSNWGNPPVDFAAPGVSILSTKKGGGTTTMSGTSMAAPHVAGILLLTSVKTDRYACSDPDGNPDPIAHR